MGMQQVSRTRLFLTGTIYHYTIRGVNDPQTDGQCGKRHATVASLIISTGSDHSTTQGECR